MFQVENKDTGEVLTVYGINGLYFLTYGEDRWEYQHMDKFRPVAGG